MALSLPASDALAFFLKDKNGEVLGGLLGISGPIGYVSTFAVAAPARGHGFGKQPMKRAGLYAVKRACIDAFLDAFGFQASRRVSRSRLVL